jgi:hypothetical protein
MHFADERIFLIVIEPDEHVALLPDTDLAANGANDATLCKRVESQVVIPE